MNIASLNTSGNHARRRRARSSSSVTKVLGQDIAASYARFSSDLQRDESNADQQRKCHEAADRNGHQILPELEYADEAVSGTKLRREGLDAMLRDAEAGEFQTLYFHSLSRLARESVITMPMLKRLVYSYRVRIISVTEGIDSDRDNWEVIASIMSLLHERYIKELAENVFRGQEGAVLAGLCIGDYRFGYRSVPIPGSEKTRKGRNAKPRKTYDIDDTNAAWVIRIFHWFVVERRSIRWITRELNRRGAPKDHRATTPDWRHQQVAGVLESAKYIGIWPWGEMKNVRDPETGKVRQEPRPEEECTKWTREFPHLRIIDQEMFDKAQQLLQENYDRHAANRRSNGRLKGAPKDAAPRHLLSGLVKCGECGSMFNVGGRGGKYLVCPSHTFKGICTCKTQLRRDRAERMILDEIGSRILSSPAWSTAVYELTVKAWKRSVDRVPTELASTQRAVADIDRKISRLVDCIENGLDDPDIKRRLEDRRTERRNLIKRMEELMRANDNRGPEPTEKWVREQLQNLGETLNCDAPAAAYALRKLVGGEIVVSEIRRQDRKRFVLRGHFCLHSNAVADAINGVNTDDSEKASPEEGITETVVVDFVDPNPLDTPANEAKKLYDQGLMNAEIARKLGWSRSQVTKLLKHWFESRGLTMPDGRGRRSQLKRKHLEPPFFERISDDVKELSDAGLLLQEIAERTRCNICTVKKALSLWYESRGLTAPDGRTRRKSLDRKVSKPRQGSVDEPPQESETE